jgi:DNA-directed RNA polymerase specialized sigma24 family protein
MVLHEEVPVRRCGMALKIRDTDLLNSYKKAPAEKRLSIMLEYYPVFPGMLRKIEKKTEYKIKSEQERMRSRSRGELGVRVQTSTISDTTANEAVANVTLEEAFKTGEVSKGLLKGIENAPEFEETIRMVSIMKMDFELLEDILSGFGREDSIIIKKHLSEGKSYRVIAEEEECSTDSVRRKFTRIREEISEEIIDCLRINCSGGEEC